MTTYADIPPAGTVAQVAEVLGVHPHTVRNLIDRGELAHVRVGRLIRIPRHAVVRFLEREPTEEVMAQ